MKVREDPISWPLLIIILKRKQMKHYKLLIQQVNTSVQKWHSFLSTICWPEFATWPIITQKCQKIQGYHVPRREEKKKYLAKCEWPPQAFLLAVKTALPFPQEIRMKWMVFVSVLPTSLESSSMMTPSETDFPLLLCPYQLYCYPHLFLSGIISCFYYLFYICRHIYF